MATITADSYGIDYTGATDVSTALANAINGQPAGTTFQLHVNGKYLINTGNASCVINNFNGITVDGQGATLFRNFYRTPFSTTRTYMVVASGQNQTIRNLRVNGYRKDTYTGDRLAAVAGTPTVASTTVLLDAQNEEVRLPQVGLDWAIPPAAPNAYLNYETPFYFRDVNNLNRFETVLSDNNHVANDCLFAVYNDETNAAISSQVLTLTGTPTTYTISFDPTALYLGVRMRITVKKLTATANTITVASITPYNEAGFRGGGYKIEGTGPWPNSWKGGSEFCDNWYFGGNGSLLLDSCWSEGSDGDGFNLTAAGPNTTLRNSTSRCAGRQGYTLENSTGTTIDGCTAREVGRSGVDIEPNTIDLSVHDATISNCTFLNVRNYGIGDGHPSQTFNLNIFNIVSDKIGMGPMAGGAIGGSITNWVHSNTYRSAADRQSNRSTGDGQPQSDACLYWQGCEVDGFTTDIGFALTPTQGGRDMHVTNAVIANPVLQFPGPLGTAPTGQTWRDDFGTWTILSGQAYTPTSTGNATTSLDAGMANVTVEADILFGPTTAGGLVFRMVDNPNFMLMHLVAPTTVNIYQKVAGAYALVGGPYTVASFASTTVHPKVVANGSTLQFYIGATLIATITNSTFITATRIGMITSSNLMRFDNFSAIAA